MAEQVCSMGSGCNRAMGSPSPDIATVKASDSLPRSFFTSSVGLGTLSENPLRLTVTGRTQQLGLFSQTRDHSQKSYSCESMRGGERQSVGTDLLGASRTGRDGIRDSICCRVRLLSVREKTLSVNPSFGVRFLSDYEVS